MVRPTSTSLNYLAKILRQAQPLYSECRCILNCLDNGDNTILQPAPDTPVKLEYGLSISNDAVPIPHTVFEPTVRRRNMM